MRGRRLGLHHRDLLHLALQDQEAVVVEVDAALAEQLGHIGEVARLAVDHVLGRVIAAGLARNLQAATRDHVEAAVLAVDDVLEVDSHTRILQRWVLLRGVDELGQLALPHLVRLEAEDEEHRIDHVRLAAAVGPDDRRHVLVKRPDLLLARVRLEVFEDHALDHQARLRRRRRSHLRRRRNLRRGLVNSVDHCLVCRPRRQAAGAQRLGGSELGGSTSGRHTRASWGGQGGAASPPSPNK